MLLEHERNYGLGMDVLVTICSWNTIVIMAWAWMLWSLYALGTLTELCFGQGCSGHRMLLEHERNYGLGMDVLVTICSWNANGIMVWAWMLWSSDALGTLTELWFGHGCSGHHMLLERERNYGLGMDALVIVCSWNTDGVGCSGHRMLCGRLHMVATRFPCAPTLAPHQLQRDLVGTTERRVHEAASHQKHVPFRAYCSSSSLTMAFLLLTAPCFLQ